MENQNSHSIVPAESQKDSALIKKENNDFEHLYPTLKPQEKNKGNSTVSSPESTKNDSSHEICSIKDLSKEINYINDIKIYQAYNDEDFKYMDVLESYQYIDHITQNFINKQQWNLDPEGKHLLSDHLKKITSYQNYVRKLYEKNPIQLPSLDKSKAQARLIILKNCNKLHLDNINRTLGINNYKIKYIMNSPKHKKFIEFLLIAQIILKKKLVARSLELDENEKISLGYNLEKVLSGLSPSPLRSSVNDYKRTMINVRTKMNKTVEIHGALLNLSSESEKQILNHFPAFRRLNKDTKIDLMASFEFIMRTEAPVFHYDDFNQDEMETSSYGFKKKLLDFMESCQSIGHQFFKITLSVVRKDQKEAFQFLTKYIETFLLIDYTLTPNVNFQELSMCLILANEVVERTKRVYKINSSFSI